jgi:hypothetical protein
MTEEEDIKYPIKCVICDFDIGEYCSDSKTYLTCKNPECKDTNRYHAHCIVPSSKEDAMRCHEYRCPACLQQLKPTDDPLNEGEIEIGELNEIEIRKRIVWYAKEYNTKMIFLRMIGYSFAYSLYIIFMSVAFLLGPPLYKDNFRGNISLVIVVLCGIAMLFGSVVFVGLEMGTIISWARVERNRSDHSKIIWTQSIKLFYEYVTGSSMTPETRNLAKKIELPVFSTLVGGTFLLVISISRFSAMMNICCIMFTTVLCAWNCRCFVDANSQMKKRIWWLRKLDSWHGMLSHILAPRIADTKNKIKELTEELEKLKVEQTSHHDVTVVADNQSDSIYIQFVKMQRSLNSMECELSIDTYI